MSPQPFPGFVIVGVVVLVDVDVLVDVLLDVDVLVDDVLVDVEVVVGVVVVVVDVDVVVGVVVVVVLVLVVLVVVEYSSARAELTWPSTEYPRPPTPRKRPSKPSVIAAARSRRLTARFYAVADRQRVNTVPRRDARAGSPNQDSRPPQE